MEKDWGNPEYCLMKVKRSGYAIDYVKNQTKELCLAAVRQNGYAIRYIREQTPEICWEALKEEYFSLKYITKQTPEMVYYVMKHDISVYESLKDDNRIKVSEEEMKEFFEKNPHLLLTL